MDADRIRSPLSPRGAAAPLARGPRSIGWLRPRRALSRLRPVQRRVIKLVNDVLPEPFASILLVSLKHQRMFGRFPNLRHPVTYNEKVIHRMLFDHRPLWSRLGDKFAARRYVAQRIGEHVLPRLYWVTQNPRDIPLERLPQQFVVKPSHGSGWLLLVRDKDQLNRDALVETCRRWLGDNFFYYHREWHYKHMTPRILIEEYIRDGTGDVPTDYKLHVFGGRVELIAVMRSRFERMRCAVYRRPWAKLDLTWGIPLLDEDLAPPRHLDLMIHYAEALAKGLDYIRVDLYDTPQKVYFGELTITPGGGMDRFERAEYDRYLGAFWTGS